MIKPNYDWWIYVRRMVQKYQYRNGKELYGNDKNEYEAVEKAIEQTLHKKDGKSRIDVVNLVMWQQTHTIAGAAIQMACSDRTAQRWCTEFIETVAKNFKCDGLIS